MPPPDNLAPVHMFQFLTGVAVGVFIGTKYDCRPLIEASATLVLAHLPKKREE